MLSPALKEASGWLEQLAEHFGGHLWAQGREGFEDAGDVGEVLLTLARAPGRVGNGPHLSLQYIPQVSDRQAQAEELARFSALNERSIS